MRKILLNILCVILFTSSMPVAADNHENEEYSDSWLQAKLVTTYTLNRHLSIFDIDVDVRDQVAHLGGTVDSSIDKNLAQEIADSVEGIKSVENNISIVKTSSEKNSTSRKGKNRTFGETIDDLTTTALIKSRLLLNEDASGLSVNVDTFRGGVKLEGKVATEKESALVEQIAKNTEGVKEVSNMLKVSQS